MIAGRKIGSFIVKNKKFNNSLSTFTPTSRKNNKINQIEKEKTISYDFVEESNNLLKYIKISIDPIVEINDYSWTNGSKLNELVLIVGKKGTYSFYPDTESGIFMLHSPISGPLQYYYDPEEKLWFGILDKHDMRGLITRDLLRHSIGCPNFD